MPSFNNDGIMIILSSPSGAGKTTLSKAAFKKNNFEISISHILLDNQDQTKFLIKIIILLKNMNLKDLIGNDEFLEYAKVFKNYYGTQEHLLLKSLIKEKMFYLILIGKVQIKLRIKNLIINL